MARRRNESVHESAAELESLASRYEGTARAARIQMLLALSQDPNATMVDLASRIGRSDRQLQRWWTDYTEGGIVKLLGHDPRERFGTVRRLPQSQNATTSAPAVLPHELMRFFNNMPTTDDPDLWLAQFHANLKAILPGVDIIILNVAQTSREQEEDEPIAMLSRKHPSNGAERSQSPLLNTLGDDQTPGEITVAQALQRGFNFVRYDKPYVVDYYVNGGTYVGTIVLWRERSAGMPIPQSTIDLLHSLHGFIAFAFTDSIKRRVASDPELRFFYDLIEKAASRINLRPREFEVFVLQLVGLPRKEIATRLHITECAVAKRAASIYRKAGTRNLIELMAE